MHLFMSPLDFPGIEDADTLIDDAEALAILSAPCLESPDLSPMKRKQVVAILRGTIMRWSEAGASVASQQSAGPFSMTVTPQVRRNSFWPSEITDLQKICKGPGSGKAFSIDTAPGGSSHSMICSLNFGATYCSCGADIGGDDGPLYELDE